MPSLTLFLAAAQPGGSSEGGIVPLLHGLGINLPGLLAQMLNFGIVAFILWYFAFKPVIATLDERKSKIEAGLKHADESKARLAAAQKDYEAKIKEAQIQAQQIVAEAQKAAKEFSDKQQQEAAEKANALMAKVQAALGQEKKKLVAEARAEVARLVVETTQRVLAKELSEQERARFNEAAARELSNV